MIMNPSRLRKCMPITGLVILLGSSSPLSAQCLEDCKAIYIFEGEATGDQFGWKSNYLGDLDNDGRLDFVISAPTNDAAGNNTGRIYIYSSGDGQELWHASGILNGGQLGTDTSRSGDIDNDGIPDVIAGGPMASSGRAIVYSGLNGQVLHTFSGQNSGDRFGFRVAGAGDADGDGHPDLLVSATFHDAAGSNSGRVYLYSGVDFSLLCTIDGEDASDEFGSALSFVGDLNNDNCEEFIIGARNAGPTAGGRAYLYSFNGVSCDLLHTFIPPAGALGFGSLFADGGRDINNDGTPDLYVADFNANRAHIYSGKDFSQLWMLTGDGNGGFGLGEMIDDVNGDQHADLVLAAWVSNNGGSQAGKIFIYSGADGSQLETFTHNIPGATFGFDANGLGDVNDDCKADYLITAAWDLNQRGRAYVIAGTVGANVTGDLDCDGSVSTSDLLILLSSWGNCPDCKGAACPADFNLDCEVSTIDLLILLSNWG